MSSPVARPSWAGVTFAALATGLAGAAPAASECRPALVNCLVPLADGLVLRTGADVLVRFDPRTGRELGRRVLSASSRLALDPVRPRLFVASDEDVMALDAELRLRWVASVRSESHLAPPVAGPGFVAVEVARAGPSARRVAVLDADTGRLLWSAETLTPVVPSGERLIVHDGTQGLIARDGRSGRVVWHKPVGHGRGRVGVGEGLVVVVDDRGEVAALSAETGAPRWTTKLPETFEAKGVHAAVGPGAALLVVPVERWRVRAVSLDLRDGQVRWTSAPLWSEDLVPVHRDGEWRLYEAGEGAWPEPCRAQSAPDFALDPAEGRVLRERRRVARVRRRPPEAWVWTSTTGARVQLREERAGITVERLDRSNRSLWRWMMPVERAGCGVSEE